MVEQGGRCRPVFVQLACCNVHLTSFSRTYTPATTDHANPWHTDLDSAEAHSRWAERCTDASSSLSCTHMSRSGAGQDHESQRCSTRPSNSGGSSAARRRRVGGAGQVLRIEARPLKQAVGGSCGEASAPELDLIIIKDPGSASSSTIRASCSLQPTALFRAQPAAGALDMSSAATRCCTPSPSVARDLVHIQKIAVRTVLPSRHERRQGGS